MSCPAACVRRLAALEAQVAELRQALAGRAWGSWPGSQQGSVRGSASPPPPSQQRSPQRSPTPTLTKMFLRSQARSRVSGSPSAASNQTAAFLPTMLPSPPPVPGMFRVPGGQNSANNLSRRLAALKQTRSAWPTVTGPRANARDARTMADLSARFTQLAGGPRGRRALTMWRKRNMQEVGKRKRTPSPSPPRWRNDGSNSNDNGNYRLPTRARVAPAATM